MCNWWMDSSTCIANCCLRWWSLSTKFCIAVRSYFVSENVVTCYQFVTLNQSCLSRIMLNRSLRSECARLKKRIYCQRPVSYVSLMQQTNIRVTVEALRGKNTITQLDSSRRQTAPIFACNCQYWHHLKMSIKSNYHLFLLYFTQHAFSVRH